MTVSKTIQLMHTHKTILLQIRPDSKTQSNPTKQKQKQKNSYSQKHFLCSMEDNEYYSLILIIKIFYIKNDSLDNENYSLILIKKDNFKKKTSWSANENYSLSV
jgi:hypothetical protein